MRNGRIDIAFGNPMQGFANGIERACNAADQSVGCNQGQHENDRRHRHDLDDLLSDLGTQVIDIKAGSDDRLPWLIGLGINRFGIAVVVRVLAGLGPIRLTYPPPSWPTFTMASR